MAQENITIKFTPEGDKVLIAALKQLDIVTKRLQGSTSKYEKELGLLNRKLKKSNDLAERKTKQLRLQSTAFATLRSNLLLYSFGIGLANKAILSFVEKSAKIENLERGFENLTKSIDTNGDSLRRLQDATDGTVNSADLLKQANNAMMLGVVKSDKEMAQLFDTAQRLGQALGKDTVSSIESLVTGMGRQSRLMLDNLGIIVKAEDAYLRYAKKIGVSKDSLSDLQRKEAFNQEVLRVSSKLVRQLGDEHLSASSDIERMNSAMTDISIVIGKILTPVITETASILQGLSKLMNPQVMQMYGLSVGFVATAFLSYERAVKGATLATSIFLKVTKIGLILSTVTLISELGISFFGLRNKTKKANETQGEFTEGQKELGDAASSARLEILKQVKTLDELLKIGEKSKKNLLAVAKSEKTRIEGLIEQKTLQLEIAQNQMKSGRDLFDVEDTRLKQARTSLMQAKTDVVERKKILDDLLQKQKEFKNREMSNEVFAASESFIEASQRVERFQEEVNNASQAVSNISPEAIKVLEIELSKLDDSLAETIKKIIKLQEEQVADPELLETANKMSFWADQVFQVASAYSALSQAQLDADRKTALAAANNIKNEKRREKEIEKVEAKFEKKQKKLNKQKQKIAIAETIMNTSTSMVKTLAEYGATPVGIALMTFAATIGALQLATIKAQKFERGGLVGGRRHSQGGTMIEAEKGEFVMSRSAVDAVGIETMNRINAGGGAGNVNISFAGNVMSDDFIESEAIPKIKEAIRRGADIGVS